MNENYGLEKPGGSPGPDTPMTGVERFKIKLKAKAAVWVLAGAVRGKWLETKLLKAGVRNAVEDKEVAKMLEELKTKLSGKKTYLVALAAIIGTVVAWVNGSIPTGDAAQQIIEAVLACTIRAGVAKA